MYNYFIGHGIGCHHVISVPLTHIAQRMTSFLLNVDSVGILNIIRFFFFFWFTLLNILFWHTMKEFFYYLIFQKDVFSPSYNHRFFSKQFGHTEVSLLVVLHASFMRNNRIQIMDNGKNIRFVPIVIQLQFYYCECSLIDFGDSS